MQDRWLTSGWHETGSFLNYDDKLTSAEAIEKAGLDWQVEERPYFYGGRSAGTIKPDPEYKAIVRATNDERLGIVKAGYVPIQNTEAFQFMDSLVEEGLINYHSAGAFNGGKRVWMLGKFGQTEIVPNDLVNKQILLLNSHDGSSSLKAVFVSIRLVCVNTILGAFSKGSKTGISIKHTKNVKANMLQARDTFNAINADAQRSEIIMKMLAKQKLSHKDWIEITEELIPDPSEDKLSLAAVTARKTMTDLFYYGAGQDIPGVAGTSWAALNAVTEYLNYHRPVRGGSASTKRLESALFGQPANLIQKSAKLLLAKAA